MINVNVIIANKYESMLQGLNIDVIKYLTGEFEVEEIAAQFRNFFFQRMILDITAIKNYKDIKTLQKLSISLDMSKVILLLDDSEESTSPSYLSDLISMGIYNFTKNLEGINYLYNNPNTYRDVAQFHQLNKPTIDEQEVPTFTTESGVRVIGVKNVTDNAGASTLIYMLKKQLAKYYKVVAAEIDRRDFGLFQDKDLFSVTEAQVGNFISKNSDKDVVLLDLNKCVTAEPLCHEILYLIEPSTIKLNKLMTLDNKALDKVKTKKVILNKSVLNSKDVLDFEYEAKIKVFFNLPPLDEREKDINIISLLLLKLGFRRFSDNEDTVKKNKLLGLFGL